METLCGDAGSRGLVVCVLEGDGRMLCYGIKGSVVHSVKLIDISDFTLMCDRTELGVICVYHSYSPGAKMENTP